jgi:hypothetical protein
MNEQAEIIQGLDLMDITRFLSRKNKSYQARILDELEQILGADTEEFKAVRKLFLDGFNEYTRSVLRTIFGTDLESL